MKEHFRATSFRQDSLNLIEYCNGVIENYLQAGLRLSLRQLYYQLVSANVIPNEEKAYKNLGSLVSKGRLAGLIDWDAIEDRIRQPRQASEWPSISSLVRSALRSFRLPRLNGQETYVELWCEKDAIASILAPLTSKYHITLMVNRGYSSQSAMYESSNRITSSMDNYGCEDAIVLYLGDLDPSGEDMVRDIADRLEMFNTDVVVEKIALNIDQVQQYQLPPNPAKLSDTRAAAFIAKYGPQSWEVDALPPKVLQQIVTNAIEGRLDLDLMQEVIDREGELREALTMATNKL